MNASWLERPAERGSGPFHSDNLVAVLGANGLGAALVFAGWWVASGLESAQAQVGWLNLSVVGLLVAGVANGLWLTRGRRTVCVARAAVLPYPPRAGSASRTAPRSNGKAPVSGELVTAPNTSRYHRSGCLLVAGKPVRMATRDDHESAGRAACEVCRP
jgi:hypothetical protein